MPQPVNKRASLPGASELFRQTQSTPTFDPPPGAAPRDEAPVEHAADASQPPSTPSEAQVPLASGRVRHDQKITVYFSSEELFALEDATLECKRAHGLKVDRGRLVRSAVALALADLAEHGADSDVVAALRAQ